MKIKSLSDRLQYIPNRRNGLSEFSGTPLATPEVYDLIKPDGINFISQKLKELIELRKELFGTSEDKYYGMYQIQLFYDLKNHIPIRIQEILDSPNKDFTLEIETDNYPSLSQQSNIGAFRRIKGGILFRSYE
ncbi:MAG: hypothetical protein ACWIPJ_10850 [Polaribacter sp.]